MTLEYDELKICIKEDFERFYKWEFNDKQIFPAILNENIYSKGFTQVENICIHIFIICLYMQNELNPDVVVEELKKIMLTQDQHDIKAELGDDYEKFDRDYNAIKDKGLFD